MDKITFLFGAGASANALPIVSEIPDRLKFLIDKLDSSILQLDEKTTFDGLDTLEPKSKKEYQLMLIGDLFWILEESKRHSSIDTFAKKLTIKHMYSELERLKIALSIFFIFEQTQKLVDNRYDTFFASIIDNSHTFPENIRILSWNYDYQFELAYSEYSGKKNISENQTKLNIHQKKGMNLAYNHGFRIYKLNGTTEIFSQNYYRQYNFIDEICSEITLKTIEDIVRNYAAIITSKNLQSTLSFAWEPEEKVGKSFLESTIDDVKDTIALVVIGYSFPFFNREVDRRIIGAMNQLKRVYFQAPDAEVLKERFLAIKDDTKNIELVLKKDVGQFLLPNEL